MRCKQCCQRSDSSFGKVTNARNNTSQPAAQNLHQTNRSDADGFLTRAVRLHLSLASLKFRQVAKEISAVLLANSKQLGQVRQAEHAEPVVSLQKPHNRAILCERYSSCSAGPLQLNE